MYLLYPRRVKEIGLLEAFLFSQGRHQTEGDNVPTSEDAAAVWVNTMKSL